MNAQSLASILPPEMKELKLKPLFIFQINVNKPFVIGKTPSIDRRVGEITGGMFEGEKLRGKILSGGSDWQTVRDDGAWMLDVRLVMQTDDDAMVGFTYRGIRHGPKEILDKIARGENVSPSAYYLRASGFFETSSDKYGYLNNVVALLTGHRLPTGPIYQVFEVL